jgi:dolichyl-phosphate beta-glucosyltransferase
MNEARPRDVFISVVIPAYNEAERIGGTIRSVLDNFSARNLLGRAEIIVVDDGSTDGTSNVAREAFDHFGRPCDFKILKNEVNRGKGYSVKQGMLEAYGEFRLFMDADNSVGIENLDRFLKETTNAKSAAAADIVIASIEMPGSIRVDENPAYRRFFGKLSKILIRVLAVPGVHDTQRGFKLFSKGAAEAIFPLQTVDRWGFDIELLIIARMKKMKIVELPVEWKNKRSNSLRFGAYPRTFFELLKIMANKLGGRYGG